MRRLDARRAIGFVSIVRARVEICQQWLEIMDCRAFFERYLISDLGSMGDKR
jgi:hypothetical protein